MSVVMEGRVKSTYASEGIAIVDIVPMKSCKTSLLSLDVLIEFKCGCAYDLLQVYRDGCSEPYYFGFTLSIGI